MKPAAVLKPLYDLSLTSRLHLGLLLWCNFSLAEFPIYDCAESAEGVVVHFCHQATELSICHLAAPFMLSGRCVHGA